MVEYTLDGDLIAEVRGARVVFTPASTGDVKSVSVEDGDLEVEIHAAMGSSPVSAFSEGSLDRGGFFSAINYIRDAVNGELQLERQRREGVINDITYYRMRRILRAGGRLADRIEKESEKWRESDIPIHIYGVPEQINAPRSMSGRDF